MNLKTFNPTTPSLRNLIQLNNKNLTKKPLLKSKIKKLKQKIGRNHSGKITASHKSTGHKKQYRQIDYLRTKESTCIIVSLEYDPFRTSNIAATYDIMSRKFSYIIAPKKLAVGDIVKSGRNADIKNGHSLPIEKIPIGCLIHNVAPKTNYTAQISRAAGTFSQLIEKTANFGRIKLSSGEQRTLSINCFATIGIVSNEFSLLTNLGKAGRSRWLGNRPKVRGVAMNPIDHPHGGGEGKTSGGRTSVTPWGKPTKGGKTSRSKNKQIIN